MVTTIKYAQYMRCLSLWLEGILGKTPEEFKNQYGSQSGRIGSASTTSNVIIPVELWGQHGDRASLKSKKRYTKRDVKSILSASIAALYFHLSIVDAPLALPLDIRDDEITSTTFDVLDDSILVVDRVPTISFRWLEEIS